MKIRRMITGFFCAGSVLVLALTIGCGGGFDQSDGGTGQQAGGDYWDLLHAIDQGDADDVRNLLKSGANPNAVADGSPILSEAIWRGEAEILEVLLEAGADPNAPLDYGSHLYNAIWLEDVDRQVRLKMVTVLVGAGADVNWTDNAGYPEILLGAVRTEDPEAVRILIEAGADPHTEPDRVPLLSVVTNEEIARMLVEAGAPRSHDSKVASAASEVQVRIEGSSHQGTTITVNGQQVACGGPGQPGCFEETLRAVEQASRETTPQLHTAATNGDKAEVERLLSLGVAVDPDSIEAAISGENPEIVRMLLDAWDDKSQRDLQRALELTVTKGGHPDIARAIVDAGAEVGPWGLLFYTAEAEEANPEMVQVLVEAGAEIDAKDNAGWTPLLVAASRGNEGMMRALIAAGADFHAEYEGMVKLLDHAIQREDIEMVRVLLNAGVDANATDDSGDPLLYRAILEDNPDIMRVLLDAGADANATDDRGSPLLHWAILSDDPEIVRALVDVGADVNATDYRGVTPLEKAGRGKENSQIIQILAEAGARE